MASKISVTKQQLLEIANTEFVKEPFYKPHMQIVDVQNLGALLMFHVNCEDENILSLFQNSAIAERLMQKYTLLQ